MYLLLYSRRSDRVAQVNATTFHTTYVSFNDNAQSLYIDERVFREKATCLSKGSDKPFENVKIITLDEVSDFLEKR